MEIDETWSFWNHYIFSPEDGETLFYREKYQSKRNKWALYTLGLIFVPCAFAYAWNKLTSLCGRGSHPVSTNLTVPARKISNAANGVIHKPPIKGKIGFDNAIQPCLIGTKRALQQPYHDSLEMVDGKNWRENSEDFWVACTLNVDVPGLPKQVHLPGCLFYTTDRGFNLKRTGDKITFRFKGQLIELEAIDFHSTSAWVSFYGSLRDIYWNSYLTAGKIVPPHVKFPPIEEVDEIEKIKTLLKKENNSKLDALEYGNRPHIPKANLLENGSKAFEINLEVARANPVEIFYLANNRLFLLCPQTLPPYNGRLDNPFHTSALLLIENMDWNKYQKDPTSTYENGVLKITFPAIQEAPPITGGIHIWTCKTAGFVKGYFKGSPLYFEDIRLPNGQKLPLIPGDFFVTCRITDVSSKDLKGLPTGDIHLPGCLFYVEDEFRYKRPGEKIIFFYQGIKFELTYAESPEVDDILNKIENQLYYNQVRGLGVEIYVPPRTLMERKIITEYVRSLNNPEYEKMIGDNPRIAYYECSTNLNQIRFIFENPIVAHNPLIIPYKNEGFLLLAQCDPAGNLERSTSLVKLITKRECDLIDKVDIKQFQVFKTLNTLSFVFSILS